MGTFRGLCCCNTITESTAEFYRIYCVICVVAELYRIYCIVAEIYRIYCVYVLLLSSTESTVLLLRSTESTVLWVLLQRSIESTVYAFVCCMHCCWDQWNLYADILNLLYALLLRSVKSSVESALCVHSCWEACILFSGWARVYQCCWYMPQTWSVLINNATWPHCLVAT